MHKMRELRIRAGLTAIALAEKAGTTEFRIFAIERRRFNPRPEEAQRIADILRVQLSELFPDVKGAHHEC